MCPWEVSASRGLLRIKDNLLPQGKPMAACRIYLDLHQLYHRELLSWSWVCNWLSTTLSHRLNYYSPSLPVTSQGQSWELWGPHPWAPYSLEQATAAHLRPLTPPWKIPCLESAADHGTYCECRSGPGKGLWFGGHCYCQPLAQWVSGMLDFRCILNKIFSLTHSKGIYAVMLWHF